MNKFKDTLNKVGNWFKSLPSKFVKIGQWFKTIPEKVKTLQYSKDLSA